MAVRPPASADAKHTVSGVRFDELGDLATVLRVLYLVFNEGYSGEVDLADEAIRLTRQVRSMTDDEEASGLLALMLLHHARRAARTTPDGTLVPLTEQDRSRWDTELIAEGVAILQAALARDRLGEYPGAGRDRRPARRRAEGGRDRLGAKSWSGTTSSTVVPGCRGIPPGASRRPRARGSAVRRRGPRCDQPRRARSPHPTGSSAERRGSRLMRIPPRTGVENPRPALSSM